MFLFFLLHAVRSFKLTFFSLLPPAYSFLDPTLQGPKLAAYIIGIAVAEVVVFSLIKIIETWRDRWAVRKGLVLEADTEFVDDEEDWQEVESPSSVKGVP
jgi:hypothetical protein